MIVNVNATLTQNVNVQLTPEECLEAIAKCLGVHSLIFPQGGNGYRCREVYQGKRIKELVLEEDISYHGSSCWQKYKTIDDKEVIANYCAVKNLYKKLIENA